MIRLFRSSVVLLALAIVAPTYAANDKVGTGDHVTVSLTAAPSVNPAPKVEKQAHIAGAKVERDGTVSPITAGGYFTVWVTNPKGEVEWKITVHNTLANDGANAIRDFFFKVNANVVTIVPVVGLLTATPTITTTLATMTEATGGGYARKAVTWATTNPGGANNTASAASWTASGTSINAVTYLFIADAASGTTGKFMAFALLTGGPYTVNVGSTLNVTYTWSVA